MRQHRRHAADRAGLGHRGDLDLGQGRARLGALDEDVDAGHEAPVAAARGDLGHNSRRRFAVAIGMYVNMMSVTGQAPADRAAYPTTAAGN